MTNNTPEAVEKEIETLRRLADHTIDLPKGVAVGLLVGIEDVLSNIEQMQKRMRTMKDFRTLESMQFSLTGPRDRLLRVIRGEFP